jgi:hypothetical protein
MLRVPVSLEELTAMTKPIHDLAAQVAALGADSLLPAAPKKRRRRRPAVKKSRRNPYKRPLQSIEVQGNRGGSYVRVDEQRDGMIFLEVGETCIRTISQEISVCALAVILTAAHDEGFQNILDRYFASAEGRGSPIVMLE